MNSGFRRGFGHDYSKAKAAKQLQAVGHAHAGIQILPTPYSPGVMSADKLGIADPGDGICFFVIGDSGEIKGAAQMAVCKAMEAQMALYNPAFILHAGDIVYYNGDSAQYIPQFYEPNAGLPVPFLAVPGNHDGDTTDDINRAPLDTFMANFCATSPAVPAVDPQFEFGRHTQTQVSHDWALSLKALNIIGLYSNVPSGGHFEDEQLAFLESALKGAAPGLPLILVAHHPAYSVDTHHGGSAYMGQQFDTAFQSSGRYPDMVIAGHVHNFQVFNRSIAGRSIRYVVQGNSGYPNLHTLAPDATPGLAITTDVTFMYGDDTEYGFSVITVNQGRVVGSYFSVTPGTMPDGSDAQFGQKASF